GKARSAAKVVRTLRIGWYDTILGSFGPLFEETYHCVRGVAAAFLTRASSEVGRTDPSKAALVRNAKFPAIRLTIFFLWCDVCIRSSADFRNRPIDSDSRWTRKKSERADFPLKSKAKKFDGSTVGFRPSPENF